MLKRLVPTFLLMALALQVSAFIVSHSNTFDEPCYISSGFSYLKTGSLELEDQFQPPFQKYLMGLAVALTSPSFPSESPNLKAKDPFRFGYEFIYENEVRPERLISMGRLPSLCFSLVLAAFIFVWASRWFGWLGGATALAAYVLEPNVLANSGIASMDIGVSCLLFLAAFFLFRFLEENKTLFLIVSGMFAGLASATKMTGLFFFAWSGLVLLHFSIRTGRYRQFFKTNAVLVIISIVVIVLIYQVRYAHKYLYLLGNMFSVVFGDHVSENYPNFLAGEHRVGGWWYYFPVAIAIKTPIPWLLLLTLGFALTPKEKRTPLLIPIISFLFICSLAQKQNGLRYVLPIYPFFCLLIGGLSGRLLQGRWLRYTVATLFVWSAVEAARIGPNYLTYFNQVAGGPRNGYKWLVDCNLDWGQDYPAVRRFLDENGRPEVIMATFGTASRDYYFGPRQDLLTESNNEDRYFKTTNPLNFNKEFLVISATLLQGFGLSNPDVFAWLKSINPAAQIANSTFVYDISRDAIMQFKIGLIYKENGRLLFAIRQFQKASLLAPDNPIPLLELADAYVQAGEIKGAQRHYRSALRLAEKMGASDLALRAKAGLKR